MSFPEKQTAACSHSPALGKQKVIIEQQICIYWPGSEMLTLVVLKFDHVLQSPGRLIQTQHADPTLRVSALVGLRWYLRRSLFSKFPGESDAADEKPQFQNHRFKHSQKVIPWGESKVSGTNVW